MPNLFDVRMGDWTGLTASLHKAGFGPEHVTAVQLRPELAYDLVVALDVEEGRVNPKDVRRAVRDTAPKGGWLASSLVTLTAVPTRGWIHSSLSYAMPPELVQGEHWHTTPRMQRRQMVLRAREEGFVGYGLWKVPYDMPLGYAVALAAHAGYQLATHVHAIDFHVANHPHHADWRHEAWALGSERVTPDGSVGFATVYPDERCRQVVALRPAIELQHEDMPCLLLVE